MQVVFVAMQHIRRQVLETSVFPVRHNIDIKAFDSDDFALTVPTVQLSEAPCASDGELALVHSSAYVASLVAANLAGCGGLIEARRKPTAGALAKSGPMSETKSDKPQAAPRTAYKVFRTISTRWMDNDAYGHVNNVVYYSWFDTAVNAYLIEQGVLDIHQGETIGLVIETQCNYFSALAFPQTVEAGIRVARLGTSSVRYEVGLFAQGEPLTAARGHFIHVYVDKQTRRPVHLPLNLKSVLETIV